MYQRCLILLLFCAATAVHGESPEAVVAIPEFQNKSGKIVRMNRWELSVWMARELEKTDQYKAVHRKTVERITADAEWSDGRLSRAVEARLLELPASHVVYGTITEWRLESAVVSRRVPDSRQATSGPAGAMVVFSFHVTELSTGKTIHEFLVDGNALGDPNDSRYKDPPYLDNDARFNDLFEEASKQAIRKAARKIADKNEG